MKRAALLVAAATSWSGLACADIYKCTDVRMVTYQSAPCAAGQAQMVISDSKRAPPSAPPVAPQRSGRAVLASVGNDVAFRRTTIALGVSDDEVLNMPGWGVPSRIDRFRDGRVYRESWRYLLPNGDARWLHFANAKLTGIEAEQTPERFAGFAIR